ncbi:mediator of RNA polymerase II transcription subunit 15-like [Rhagoletis pomonella]|uniref:mediator of RNA polymerase II transcription subunit 15-like n=1 Tax=Rhagoletis pomonella TaxID=28610 RepID=UPI001784FC22|nr:mediator of RNA polymerase II transcription subunit 15-like [Rhagoletis pomonella]XP_036328842.1 mediator of RNA polymerase II transcription subunit 15-like [Rhagoletis pomonella]XP_036328843.1 mediator of RNA polymerase II transcription subunit 15-like [Rhagoletis pomonella]XP_036328845.1 mediator of RNA polymerase II transcription subunit 15-like [Rhagoletis pomonella]XP_036328846.1 mediator of RNA polymerase II transcription subunit 15-like [Rhagoletis pomonella]
MEVRGKCRWKANQKTQKQLQEKQQELQPQQTTQQLLQLAQRKCHQKQSERTNHLRLHKTQNQQLEQNPHHTRPKPSIITQQQPKTLQHTYSTNERQQQQQQQQQKECQREPKLSPIYHHRWPMLPLLLTHTPTKIHTPSAKPTRTSTNPNVVNKIGRFTAAATSCSIAIVAVTKTKTLSKIVCGCMKRLTWLWLLALLGTAQFTATAPTLAATSTAAAAIGVLLAPKLLPHVMFTTTTTSTSAATAVATAAAILAHASAAHAAIIAADHSTATSSTIEPRLRRYKFPIGEADVAEMVVDPNADADADALVQVQVKRIYLLDNEGDDDAASPPAPSNDEFDEAEEEVVPAQEALYADEDEDETETEQLVQQASNRKLNSNEQQWLVFYRRVQHATEQEAQTHQKPQRQQSATHRNYQHDDGGRELLPNIRDHSKLDDVGVASTKTDATALLTDSELADNLEHKHVTKRSATTKLSSTTVAPTSGAPVEVIVGSGKATSNVTAAADSTVEEKCEPKVLDEVPPEPVVAMKSLLQNGGVVKNLKNILSTAITADYNLYGIHGKKSLKDVSNFYAALKASIVAPAGKSVEDQLRHAIQNQKKKILQVLSNSQERLVFLIFLCSFIGFLF